jgi:hypothetical protein
MLTVLKENRPAFDLYVGKLKYEMDLTSPSMAGAQASYEILSKAVDKAAVAAIEARVDAELAAKAGH